MESFNFGAFDPTIGARIAAIPQEAQKQQTANMLQAMQMQGAMNQNELAQSQMRTARRAEEGQTLLGKAYGGLDFSGAGDGGVPGQSPYASMKSQVIKSLTASNRPDLIPGELAKLTEMEHKANVNEELIGKINQQKTVAQNSESRRYKDALVNVTNYDSAAYWLRHQYDNPVLKNIVGIVPFETALAEIPKDFVGLEDWKKKNALGIDEYIKQNKPNITTRNTGTITELLSTPGLGGSATVVPGSQATMQMTPGQVRAAADAKLSREQSERHFQAGGGIIDLDRGIRIDRNGIATPLMQQAPAVGGAAVGGGVPSNAPVSGGIPTGRGSAAGLVPLGSKPEKPPVEFTKSDNQLSNLVGNLNRFKQEIAKGKTTSAQWAPTGADTAAMNSKYIALLMGIKDMYTLGALTGPDLDLIEKQISNPATWGGFTKSKEAFNAQIDTVEQQLKDASKNLENSYGHKPKATTAAFLRNPVSKVPDVWVRDASGNLVKQQVKQ